MMMVVYNTTTGVLLNLKGPAFLLSTWVWAMKGKCITPWLPALLVWAQKTKKKRKRRDR